MHSVISFGLRSAPKIFTAVADALQFVLQENGVHRNIRTLPDAVWSARYTAV